MPSLDSKAQEEQMPEKNSNDVVKNVVEVLNDGHKGFMDFAQHIKDPEVKAYFVKESQTRAEYSYELQTAAGIRNEEQGTSAGAVHRFWGDVKAKLGGGDHTILETAEQGEDAAKEAYQKALTEGATSAAVREVLMKQQAHIRQSHDQVKAFRDRKAA
jgi:uncharacterized protein (TIGR02284 family)